MAVAGGKKKMKVDIEINVFDETAKENKAWAEGNAELKKVCKPIKFKDEAELDDRKWNARKLEEEAFIAVRMGLKIFAGCVRDAKKKADQGKEKDGVKAVLDGYSELEKEVSYGLEKWLDDIESGKADNAKALKAGKSAFEKINSIEFKGAFDGPVKKAIEALKPLTKEGADEKAKDKAAKTIEGLLKEFGDTGKQGQKAVDFLLKTGRTYEKDKSVDPAIQEFAKDVLKGKNADTFEDFLNAAEDFTETFEEVVDAVKDGGCDAETAKTAIKALEGLDSLQGTADKALALAKTMTKAFNQIAGKLK
jgi:hypothetical protein